MAIVQLINKFFLSKLVIVSFCYNFGFCSFICQCVFFGFTILVHLFINISINFEFCCSLVFLMVLLLLLFCSLTLLLVL
jgi:hypothetical protein